MKKIDLDLEKHVGNQVILPIKSYKPKSNMEFGYKPARLTPRQAVFYRNLISIAQYLESNIIPMVFVLQNEGKVHLDCGCVKMAEYAGFIRTLRNAKNGIVEEIELSFRVDG